MFQVMVGLKEIGEYPTFPEAFRIFYVKVMECEPEYLTRFVTTCFIYHAVNGMVCIASFDDVKRIAHMIGVLTLEGKLSDLEPEALPEVVVDALFFKCHDKKPCFVYILKNGHESPITYLSKIVFSRASICSVLYAKDEIHR